MPQAKYFPALFTSKYALRGRAWIRQLEPDDLRVFVDIGLQAADHGRAGGQALVRKHGREHMSKIARIGAIATNSKKAWIKAIHEELLRLEGAYND